MIGNGGMGTTHIVVVAECIGYCYNGISYPSLYGTVDDPGRLALALSLSLSRHCFYIVFVLRSSHSFYVISPASERASDSIAGLYRDGANNRSTATAAAAAADMTG